MKRTLPFIFLNALLRLVMAGALLFSGACCCTLNAQQLSTGAAEKKVPDFLLLRSDGKQFNTAEQKGKVTLLNFWAASCIPCITEMPSINQLYLHFIKDTDVLIIAIDADDDFNKSVAFMSSHNLSLPVYNSAGVVPAAYFRGVLPTTVLLNKKGHIVHYYEGGMDYSSQAFISLVDSLRNEP